MLRKINNKTEENNQKIEKNDRKDEKYNEKKYLNKNNDQTIDDCDFNVSFTQDQRFFKVKIKQKNKIDNLN